MLPLRRVPPSGGPPLMEIVNESLVPGSPLSCAITEKVHGAPLFVHAPLNVAVLPLIVNVVNVTLCTFAPLAWLTYCRSPPIGPVLDCACTIKPKLAMPPVTSTVPPPVTLPMVGGGGTTASLVFPTKASKEPPPDQAWNGPALCGEVCQPARPVRE